MESSYVDGLIEFVTRGPMALVLLQYVLEGTGSAAGEAYAWAIENPDKVSCIYGENPVLRSLMSKNPPAENLASLAKARVPLLHLCGSLDPWLKDRTRVVEERYQELGGSIIVIVREGEGHFLLGPKDRGTVVDFIVSQGLSKDTGPQ